MQPDTGIVPVFRHISLIGAGRLAGVLARQLFKLGIPLHLVLSRSSSAHQLASEIGAEPTDKLEKVCGESDLIIIAIPDDHIAGIASRIEMIGTRALTVHTSGSMPRTLLAKAALRNGVFYPLQSFSPGRAIPFEQIPVCLDAASDADFELLKEFASHLGCPVYRLDDDMRRQAHLAAVFANNFSNALFCVAGELLAEKQLPFELLLPLIQETARKLVQQSPAEAQTGPALRGDMGVIEKHLQLLAGRPELQSIYKQLSLLIRPGLHL